MVLESCPMTEDFHNFKRNKICKKFPLLRNCGHNYYLSLWRFLCKRPERFYCNKTYEDIKKFLDDTKKNDQSNLIKILHDYDRSLFLAFRTLDEINQLEFHDLELSEDEYDLMKFCDIKIHSNYLKLTETVYSNLIVIIAAYQRIKRNASLEGLNLYSRAEELKNTEFEYISECYHHVIRNAIAHGKVTYKQKEIFYEDSNGNEKIPSKNMVYLFDQMLDICNGFALAFSIFYLTNLDFFEKNKIKPPAHLLLQELKAIADAPGWEIRGCLDSRTIDNRSQLIIFTKNNFLDSKKLNYYVLRSAILAEKFSPGYDRYFFSLNSKYSLKGWSGFIGPELKRLRLKNDSKVQDYKKSIENGLIFFRPKIRIPNFIFKLLDFFRILKNKFIIRSKERNENRVDFDIIPRYFTIHRNVFHSVIRGRIVIESDSIDQIDKLIRANLRVIVRKSVSTSRKNLKKSYFLKLLHIGYIRLGIYSQDFRKRKLKNSGLIPELICTIEIKKLKRIETIDIVGGKPEINNKFRIVWNKNCNIDAVKNMF